MIELPAFCLAILLATPQQVSATTVRLPRIPAQGAVPVTADADFQYTEESLSERARQRDDAIRIREIARKHFGSMRVASIRAEGVAKLAEFTDPSSMVPMYHELRKEGPDVLRGMLDHFVARGEPGQAALAWVAINDEDSAMRAEATRRINRPPSPAILGVLDASLRQNNHMVANRAGALAGALGALETIPLLIFSQVTSDPVEQAGDLAWIAIGTQQAYVANVVPVLGGSSGAFQPVIGVITEGVLLRVMDAVAYTYRADIHNSLVAMTSADWGQSTDAFGYDIRRWWAWYNDEYLPFKERQLAEAARDAKAAELERKAIEEEES